MTGQEIESLESIYNETELTVVPIESASEHFEGDVNQIIEERRIRFLVKLSLIPKAEDESVEFVISDERMGDKIRINALPSLEVWLALPEGYPSHEAPLFMQRTNFYATHFKL